MQLPPWVASLGLWLLGVVAAGTPSTPPHSGAVQGKGADAASVHLVPWHPAPPLVAAVVQRHWWPVANASRSGLRTPRRGAWPPAQETGGPKAPTPAARQVPTLAEAESPGPARWLFHTGNHNGTDNVSSSGNASLDGAGGRLARSSTSALPSAGSAGTLGWAQRVSPREGHHVPEIADNEEIIASPGWTGSGNPEDSVSGELHGADDTVGNELRRQRKGQFLGLPKIFWALVFNVLAMAAFVLCIPYILYVAKRRRAITSSSSA